MKKEELFTDLEFPQRRAASMRTSPLASYVLDELPADLTAAWSRRTTYRDLADRQSRLLHELGPLDPLVGDLAQARVVQLDLLFMLGGYQPAGPGSAPRSLVDAVAAQCARFPELDPHMSYELLIDVNADEWHRNGDIRVFTQGATSRLERDFYLGHHLSEPSAQSAFNLLSTMLQEPDAGEPLDVLEDVVRHLEDFRLYMAQYGRLPKDAFETFRRYHMGHPGGPRGASGAFLPSVQLLELVLLSPTPQYELYLDQSMAYFPVWSRPLLTARREASRQGDNVVSMVLDGRMKLDPPALTALLHVLDKFADFRMVHLGVTKKTIPEAFPHTGRVTRRDIARQAGEEDALNDDHLGTSGFSVHNLLTNSVYRLLSARREIASLDTMAG
ncbi:hypothetical protein [Streptomyces sp. NPDC026673]|uniref:hypothetical protein n=1 Tax=Streptomyces sp. NPDC026673 TaxID=3155724 RepID=UPI0033D5C75C